MGARGMDLGYTSTRRGLSAPQRTALARLVRVLLTPTLATLHLRPVVRHGLCIRGDEEFHDICWALPVRPWIVGHPPSNPVLRSSRAMATCDELEPVAPYMVRNRRIVERCNVLVAAPLEMERRSHGGTWRTVTMAQVQGRPMYIVWRDGRITRDPGEIAW